MNLQNNEVRNRIRAQYGENRALGSVPDQGPSVRCENGTFVGRTDDHGNSVFRGIPYAKAPVGSRRWKKAEPPDPSDGVFTAVYNGKTPIQTEWASERASYYPQGEDCLYLNVWTGPMPDAGEKRAVMVFFHGGSYGWGGTADPLYDGAAFANAHPDIVLITVGYRTGILGFINFSEVPGGEAYPDSCNLGILDQVESLRWIRRNVAAFGGDPDNVTVFGESAGGGSVSILAILPCCKGLFHRVIAQSGSVALTFSKEESLPFTRKLLEVSGARTMAELLALSEADLMRCNEPINASNNFPVRDGILIPEDAYAPYEKGDTADVDLLIGTNANELNYWIGELGGFVPFSVGMRIMYACDRARFSEEDAAFCDRFISSLKGRTCMRIAEFYNELLFRGPAIHQAEAHARNGGKTYLYFWNEPSALPHRGSCHAVELAYVFGNTSDTVYTGREADPGLSGLVMDMWANFAKTGDPSAHELNWKPFLPAEPHTMVLSRKPGLEMDYPENRRALFDALCKYRVNGATTDPDFPISAFQKMEGLREGLGLAVQSLFLKP
ncbi:MAG: carboxylesterase family protein [Clostridia bacterium]|nr:carboxylesterase family protein [Clostridia bacterium]